MSMLQLEKLTTSTLHSMAHSATGINPDRLPTLKKELAKTLALESEIAGVKELAFMMNALELRDICDNYLKVEYREGANLNNKMMLTKRFIESFDNVSVSAWFKQCSDRAILQQLVGVMGLKVSSKTPIQELQAVAVEQIVLFGEQVVLHRMTVPQLRQICDEMRLKNSENTTSKKNLIDAILTKTHLPERAAPKRKVVTRKVAIEKAKDYEQLFQHYKAADLEEWSRENGLKTHGTKKVLIERILAFHAGDKENTMSHGENKKLVTKKETKPKEAPKPKVRKAVVTKKPQKVVEEELSEDAPAEEDMEVEDNEAPEDDVEEEEPSEEQAEDSQNDDEDDQEEDNQEGPVEDAPSDEDEAPADDDVDEDAQARAIDAERQLRTSEFSEDIEMDMSEPETTPAISLEGLKVTVGKGDFKRSRAEIVTMVGNNGGTYTNQLTKKVDLFIGFPETKPWIMAVKHNIRVVTEDEISHLF